MRSRLLRLLALLSFAGFTAIPTVLAASERDAELMREELAFLSDYNPFPNSPLSLVDPLSKKKMEHVITGPAFKTGRYSGYDYYRYVTYYNVTFRKERIYDLFIQRAQCYEKSELFANYTSSKTYSATITASATLEGLGLSAAISETRTFSTGHGIAAQGGMVADYTPYMLEHDWKGRTLIQLMNSKTGKTQFVTEVTDASPFWFIIVFPMFAHNAYPMDFEILGADRTFTVDREIIEVCNTSFGAR